VTVIEFDTAGGAVVEDLAHEEYLRHPALSASGAKTLVQPGGPARFAHERTHPRPPTDAMDLGTAAHAAVLGTGPQLGIVDAPDWRGKVARERRDALRAEGIVPLLTADAVRVEDMAAALRAHPVASRLLHPDSGRPEVSLFYSDPEYGVDRRCRVDFLREPDDSGRLLLVDFKSCQSAAPEAIDRAIGNYGYHLSAAWYRDLIIGLGLATTVPVLLVFQETSAPYLVHVVELGPEWLEIGYDLTHRALTIFRECTQTGHWPGYEGITHSTPPPWLTARHQLGDLP
jgi:PDDEXK-like domain of unknown function (DUF3799)